MHKDHRAAIRREQLRLAIEHLPTMQVASIIVALALAYTVRNIFPIARIASWILPVLAVTAGRLILYRQFFKTPPELPLGPAWKTSYLLLSVASGIAWGLSAFILLPVGNMALTAIFVLVVASLSATTTVSHSSMKYGSAAWVAPVMTLYAVRLCLQNGEIERITGFLAVVYMVTILRYSFKHHRMIVSSIALRFENQGLLEEARQSEERYRILFQRSPVGIFLYDECLRVTECNQRFCEILGSPREALVGLDMNLLTDLSVLPALRAPLDGRDGNFEGRYQATISKLVRFVSMHTTPYYKEKGTICGGIGIVEDITGRKRTEEEMARSEKLDSIGILAGGIAHDINNFLTVINGNVTLAKMYANRQGEVYKRLEEAEKAVVRAKDVARQLLTFSKGGAPVKRVTSIRELTKESAGFALRGSNVKCEFLFPDDLWAVEADEGQLSQVVNNLLINAAHSMPEGGTIQVACRNVVADPDDPMSEAGNHVSVSIMDHGIGIPQEHLSRVFDPYFTTKEKGSGLGLSTAYSIIKKHGGHLAVESDPGIGTSFHFSLPAAEGAVLNLDVEEKRFVPGNGRVLVMDDEETVRDIAREMLQVLGYTVRVARDGTEAIAIYRQSMASGEPMDLVLMDLTIPGGMGGKEAIGRLLEIDPEANAVVCSGYSNDPVMSSCRAYGFRGVIQKPYGLKQLGDMINGILSPDSAGRLMAN